MDERIAQLIRQGQTAAQQGNNEMARGYLEAAVELDPDNVIAWLWLAGVQDEPARARQALQHVLELDPDNARARQGLAQLEAQGVGAAPPEDEVREGGAYVFDEGAAFADDEEDDVLADLSGDTSTMSIEQELRAALRRDPLPDDEPVDVTNTQAFRARLTSGSVAADTAPTTTGRFSGGPTMAYMVATAALGLLLLVGVVCFVLTLLNVGPI